MKQSANIILFITKDNYQYRLYGNGTWDKIPAQYPNKKDIRASVAELGERMANLESPIDEKEDDCIDDLSKKLCDILDDHCKCAKEMEAAGGGVGLYRGTIQMIKKAFGDDDKHQPEVECECQKRDGNWTMIALNSDGQCVKCGRQVNPKPKKIEPLDMSINLWRENKSDDDQGDISWLTWRTNRMRDKINEIIDALNGRKDV